MNTEINKIKKELTELINQKEKTVSDKHYHRLINKIEDKKRELFLLGGTL